MELTHRLKAYQVFIDRSLDALLSQTHGMSGPCGEALDRLHASMRYTTLAGGKRLRPVLCLAAAEYYGVDAADAIDAACAMEAIHVFSLIQDDFPAMDDDDLRRGKPANHKVYGEAVALLASDALLNVAYAWVIRSLRCLSLSAERGYAALECVIRSVGHQGMIAGQIVDMHTEGNPDLSEADLAALHGLKTGALISGSIELGAILGGASQTELAIFRRIGRDLGLAFQVVDDILDHTQSTELLGKPAGSDAGRARLNYFSLLGEGPARQRATELIDAVKSAALELGPRAEIFVQLADYVLERQN